VVALKPNHQLRIDTNAQFIADLDDGTPTFFGIRAARRTLHESNVFVAQFAQMYKGQLGRASVIKNQIRHTFYLTVSGDGYCRKGGRFVD
jgi:hypothetical protein